MCERAAWSLAERSPTHLYLSKAFTYSCQLENMPNICTGCPAKRFTLRYLFFCPLLLMQIAKSGTFLKNSGNLLHDRHKNLKIDLEIAEIIEVKVATFNMEIIFLPL